MNRIVFALSSAALMALSVAVTRADTLTAAKTGMITTAGPKLSSGSVLTSYFDVEANGPSNYSGSTDYRAFGVIDFATLGGAAVPAIKDDKITLGLTDSIFSQTRPGDINFYLVTGTTPIANLKYDGSATNPQGVSGQLGSLYFLGTKSYTATKSSTSQTYAYDFTLSKAAETYLLGQLNGVGAGNLRFAITGTDTNSGNGVAGFYGSSAAAGKKPTLTYAVGAAPVPEVGALTTLFAPCALFSTTLLARRKKRD